jgi:SAM-dependent methyltransferase
VDAPSEEKTRAYYDDFSAHYEDRRGKNVPHGYHDLLDHLESDFVRRFATGKKVLEVGCGTGLVLERIARFAAQAEGVDLSPGMLKLARDRGLSVQEASATRLPFPDGTFDVTCSFKVLPHVPEIEAALGEMARVTRPGLLRALGPARRIGKAHAEKDVFTRFDSPGEVARKAPPGTALASARGVRVLTATAQMLDSPLTGPWLYKAECWAADSPLRRFGGFYIAAYQKG